MNTAPALSDVLVRSARLVAHVARGRSLATRPADLDFGDPGVMRGAVMDVTYSTLRRYGRGDALINALARRGVSDLEVRALLLCTLSAIETARYAEHVAVDQAVRACASLRKPGAKSFVNALLRGFLRERSALEKRLTTDRVASAMHPAWWIDRLHAAYPQDWEAILQAGNEHPPMGLRVNRRRVGAAEYVDRLQQHGMPARHVRGVAVLLERPVRVDQLPGFGEGEVSVQDPGAQRAAEYLDLADGQRVLDACAAPGGKTGHILEIADVDLLALDSDPLRCRRVSENLTRLALRAHVVAADCAKPEQWWDGSPFDRILADVPCTASGIARRNPDIKWLRRAGDSARFSRDQARILDGLWRVLAQGGKLLYVTCSVFPEENAAVVEAFCARQPDARRLGLPQNEQAQLLPGTEHDGFFYALLQKHI